MANFLARSLRFLGSGFNIRGGEVSTDQLDLSSVQLVVDVASNLVEGRQPGPYAGFAQCSLRFDFTATSGASTPSEVQTIDPYEEGSPGTRSGLIVPFPSEFNLWLFGVGLSYRDQNSDGSTITAGSALLRTPGAYQSGSTSGNSTGSWYILGVWADQRLTVSVTDSFQQRRRANENLLDVQLPMLIPRKTQVNDVDQLEGRVAATLPGTGNGDELSLTANMNFLFRIVPRGLSPIP